MSFNMIPPADDPNNSYGYIPTRSVTAIFLTLFILTTIAHTGQAIYYRLWWLFPTAVLAGIGETIGWSARVWSSINVDAGTPFLMQISTTIISPTPLVAANFIMLGKLVREIGPQYGRLTPRQYTVVFLSVDIISLVIQALGGGIASAANTTSGSNNGGHIMLVGIAFQLVAITIYIALAVEYFHRYLTDRPMRPVMAQEEVGMTSADTLQTGYADTRTGAAAKLSTWNSRMGSKFSNPRLHAIPRRFRLMIFGLALSSLVIFIRSIYRLAELSDGWHGRIIRTEVYFNVLDGAMVIIAFFTLNVLHPGLLLYGRPWRT